MADTLRFTLPNQAQLHLAFNWLDIELGRHGEGAKEEIDQLAREQARREAYLAREKATAEDREAKKLKNKKQPPE